MSRSGYSDDCDDENWAFICYRGAVTSAMRGKRGQAVLREILAALDALPEKRLVTSALESEGSYCTLGALGAARGLPLSEIDPDDYEAVARHFGMNEKLAREIMYINDEGDHWEKHTPEDRWQRMRAWVAGQIKPAEKIDG